MHPLLALGTGTGWIDGAARRGLRADRRATPVAQVRGAPAGRGLPLLARTTRPAPRSTLDVVEAVAGRGAGHGGRRRGVRRVRPARHAAARSTLLPGYPRLVVTRTMSKAFAFAGGRLGYLAADPAVVDAVQLVRLPYHLSALTQAAARAALAHAPTLLATVEAIKAQRDRIVAALRELGLHGRRQRRQLRALRRFAATRQRSWQALLDAGVLVRDVGLPGWLRVTAGTPAETDAFLTAMAGAAMPDGCSAIGWREARPADRDGRAGHRRDKVLGRARPRRHRRGRRSPPGSGSTTTCSHQLGQARRLRPDRADRGRPGRRRAPHGRGHRARARRGARPRRWATRPASAGSATPLVPLDEVLVQAAVDLSGRPYVVHDEPAGWRRTSGPASTRPR